MSHPLHPVPPTRRSALQTRLEFGAFAVLAGAALAAAVLAGAALEGATGLLLAGALFAYARSLRRIRQLEATFDTRVREQSADLRSSRTDLLAILDAVPSMICYWDRQLINRFANAAYRRHFDRGQPGGLVGRPILDVLGEELLGRVRPHVEAALRGEPRIMEHPLARPDGSEPRHSVAHFLPDQGIDGEVRGFHVLVHDVDELTASRSKLAAALREHDGLLHTIHVHSLVSVSDGAGRIVDVNDGFCHLSGYSREELLGQTHHLLNSGVQDREFWATLWRAVAAGLPWRGEICNRAKNGTLYWVDSFIAPFIGADGRIDKCISILSDITAAKATEQKLRASESFLDRAGRIAGVGSWEFDIPTQTLAWSAQAYRIHELEPDGPTPDLAGALAFYPEEARQTLTRAIAAATLRGTPWDIELPMTTAKARAIWVRVVCEPEFEAGVPVKLVGAVQDVTARKQIEARLHETDERFKIASDSAGIGVWDFDVVGDHLTWNDWMYRIYGVSQTVAEEPYALWLNSLHPDDRDRCAADIALALSGDKEFTPEFRIVRPDGEIRHITAAAHVIRDEHGAPLRMTGVNFDVTVQRRAEQQRREAASLLRTVLDSTAQISIIATDPSLTIRVFNAGAERLLGYTSEEVVGIATPIMMHDPEELKLCGEELSRQLGYAIDDGAVFAKPPMLQRPREWTYVRKDGGRLTVSMVVTAMHADGGELLGYVCVAHDVTRQNKYEESLRTATGKSEQANRAKSEFLANMSHEIRTPLNAIIGLGYLLEQTGLSEDQGQFLSKIQFAGRALLGVINNVLDLSKVEAGEMTLENESFDLPELVRDLGAMLAPQAAVKGIELAVDFPADLPRMVQGDALRLRQILINLVNNSIKFTEAGRVALRLSCPEPAAEVARVRCEVADTGIGIEPEALERLFTPFTQADTSTTRRFGGTGLGLSIARRLVELMGGEIGVESVAGTGSTFWIEIPLRLAGGVTVGTEPVRGLQVCVADSAGDGPGGLGAMVRALGWSPQIVDSVERLAEVLQGAKPSSAPDVLIVELHLEDGEARRLIGRLEQALPRGDLPPIIVVADLPQSFSEYGKFMRPSDVVLVRPVTSSALFNAVNSSVWRRFDDRERVLRYANFDELHTQWLSGVRILVADDSDINLEVAQRILEKQGAIVRVCSDGRAALEAVRTHHQELDAVLMDVQMPVLDGNEATRRIRGELRLTLLPIIALTAGALVAERQRSLEAGMNDFISKPFDPQALIRKVRHVVEQVRGRPIPMVMRPSAPAASELDLSRLASIDTRLVQRTFGTDLSLWKLLVPRMLREFADLALPVAVPEDATLRASLRSRAHKLKGSAGMIGAIHVMRYAGAVERALADEQPADVVEANLQQLAARLITLRDEAVVLVAAPAAPAAAAATGSSGDESAAAGATGGTSGDESAARSALVSSDIEDLYGLLEDQDLAAMGKFDSLSQRLRETLQMDRFDRLKLAIENLDFHLGADLLRDMRRAG